MATGNNGTSKNLRPWAPGQSGNPSGRPKGIARQLREAINDDPTRVTNIFLAILDDEDAKPADRIAAGREILDRAYGKAPTFAPIDGEDPLDLQTLTGIRGLVDDLRGTNTRRADDGAPAEAPSVVPGSDSPDPELDQGRPSGATAA